MSHDLRVVPTLPRVQDIRLTTETTIKLTPFDQREYRKLIEARGETLRRVVTQLKPVLGLWRVVAGGKERDGS